MKLTIICVEKFKDHKEDEVVIKEDEILKYQVQYSIYPSISSTLFTFFHIIYNNFLKLYYRESWNNTKVFHLACGFIFLKSMISLQMILFMNINIYNKKKHRNMNKHKKKLKNIMHTNTNEPVAYTKKL
jgi:hypothetical protein